MKKILSAALFTLLLFSLSLPACTEETEPESFKSGDYAYIVREDGTAQITSYGGDGHDIVIPNKLSGYPVRAIGDDAFSECPNLTLTVVRDSYAARYCKENGLNYTYTESLDWLNN